MARPSLTFSFPEHSTADTIDAFSSSLSSSNDASSSSPSTSVTDHSNEYDVFINHRGPNVKKDFASPLYYCLCFCGLRAFLDKEELQRGEKLTSQIEKAIKSASVHVAVFCRRYAESEWCLRELVWMLESKAPIIPVFYGVKPADFRRRSKGGMFAKILRILGLWTRDNDGVYEQALLNLEKKKTFDPKTKKQKLRYEPNTIEDWRNALSRVSEISGFELEACNDDKGELLNKIVQRVKKIVRGVRKPPLDAPTKYRSGLVEKVEELEKKVLVEKQVEKQSGKAQVVGIVGLGGIGKTTLAIEFYNRNSRQYQASSFLFGVREAEAKRSLHDLQTQLFRDLSPRDGCQIDNIYQGTMMLRDVFSPCQALVVLDGIDHANQVDALLLPLKDVLRPTSLILVTSRNKELLTGSGILESSIYRLTGLSRQHSQELFCGHAFGQPRPSVGFGDMVAKFLDACDHMPLSLKVIGALLYKKHNLEYWESQLKKISRELPSDIQSTLKISYDSLDDDDKEIFLDIACFFVGEDKDTVIRVSEGSGWEGSLGIANLENKCLLEVDKENRIRMHDHLRDLGRYLAQKEPPQCLLRLWRPNDITTQNVHSSVRGIRVASIASSTESTSETDETTAAIGAVSAALGSKYGKPALDENPLPVVNMSRLQLLEANGDCLESIFNGLQYSPDLVWFCWYNSPHSTLPSWLPIRKLRVLQLTGGQPLQTLWESESQVPLQLRELIVNVPILQLPKTMWHLKHLEKIELRDQGSMVFLPDSFGNLTNLQYLDFSGSSRLQELPHSFGNLIRLEHICLAGCSKLQELPHSFGNFIRLKHLCLAGCSELSIFRGTLGNITTLVSLDLSFCLKMKELPPQVASQQSLKELNLLGTSLRVLSSDQIGEPGRLETLKLGSPFLKMLPASLGDLKTLKELTLSDCRSLECLPKSVGELKQLTKMEIIDSEIQYLPIGVREMNNLEFLKVHSTPLRDVPFAKKVVTGTKILTETMIGLKYLELHETRISELVFLEGICPNLQHLKIEHCNDLVEVGALPTSLITLEILLCGAVRKIEGLYGLAKLRQLHISGCKQVEVPPSLGDLTTLQELTLADCKNLECLPDLVGELKQLTKMEIINLEIQYLPIGVRKMSNLEILKVHSTPLLSLPFAKRVITGPEISTETAINKAMVGIKYLELHKTRISELFFLEGVCPHLQHLKIEYCNDLVEVGALPRSLITLEMPFCGALEKIGGLCGLAMLRQLDIRSCNRVEELPSLESLTSLEELRASECKNLKRIQGLAQLAKLWLLDVENCHELEELAGIENLRSLKSFQGLEGLTGINYLRSLKEFEHSGCPKLQVEQLPVLVSQKAGPGRNPSDDEKSDLYHYTNDSSSDSSELLKACESFLDWNWLDINTSLFI